MKAHALAALAATLVSIPANAQVCHPGGYGFGYKQVQVVTPAVGVVVPLYGASYNPSTFNPTGGDPTDVLGQILEEIKAMRKDIAALKGGEVGAMGGKDPVAIVRANCAGCHSGDAEKGGGFALFTADDKPIKLSPADRREIGKRVGNGSMPPPSKGKLSQADKDALLGALKDAPPAPKKDPAPKK